MSINNNNQPTANAMDGPCPIQGHKHLMKDCQYLQEMFTQSSKPPHPQPKPSDQSNTQSNINSDDTRASNDRGEDGGRGKTIQMGGGGRGRGGGGGRGRGNDNNDAGGTSSHITSYNINTSKLNFSKDVNKFLQQIGDKPLEDQLQLSTFFEEAKSWKSKPRTTSYVYEIILTAVLGRLNKYMLQNPNQYKGGIAEYEKFAPLLWHDFILSDFIKLANTDENMDTAIRSLKDAKASKITVLNAHDMSVSDSSHLFTTTDDARACRAVADRTATYQQFYQLFERYCQRYYPAHAMKIMNTLKAAECSQPDLKKMFETKGALLIWIQSYVNVPHLRFQPLRVYNNPHITNAATSPTSNTNSEAVQQSTVPATNTNSPIKSSIDPNVVQRLKQSLSPEAITPPFQTINFALAKLSRKKRWERQKIVLRQLEQYIQIHYPDQSMILMKSLCGITSYNFLQDLFVSPKKFAVHAIKTLGQNCFVPAEGYDDTLAGLPEDQPLPSNVQTSSTSGSFSDGLGKIVETTQFKNQAANELEESPDGAQDGQDFVTDDDPPARSSNINNSVSLSWRFLPTVHPESNPTIRTLSTSTFATAVGKTSSFRVQIQYSGDKPPCDIARKYYHAVNSVTEEVKGSVALVDADGEKGMIIVLRGLGIGESPDPDAIHIPPGENVWAPYILNVVRSERSKTTTFELILHTNVNIFMMQHQHFAKDAGCPAAFQHMRILQGGLGETILSVNIIEQKLLEYTEIAIITGTHLYPSITNIKHELFTRIGQNALTPVTKEMFELSWEYRSNGDTKVPVIVVYAYSPMTVIKDSLGMPAGVKRRDAAHIIHAMLTLEQGDPLRYPLTHDYNVHNCIAPLAIKQLPTALEYQQYFLANLCRLEITNYPLWLPSPQMITTASPNIDNLKIHELLVRVPDLFCTSNGNAVLSLFTEALFREGSLVLLFKKSDMSTVLFNLKTIRDMFTNWLDIRDMAQIRFVIPGVTYLNGHGPVYSSELESLMGMAIDSALHLAEAGDDSQVEKIKTLVNNAQSKLRPFDLPQELPPSPASNGTVNEEVIARGVFQALQKYKENNDQPITGILGVSNHATVMSSITSSSEERLTSIFATSLRRVLEMNLRPQDAHDDDDDDEDSDAPTPKREPPSLTENHMTLIQLALGANLSDAANTQRRVAMVLADFRSDIDTIKSLLKEDSVNRGGRHDTSLDELFQKVGLLCDKFVEEKDTEEEKTELFNNLIHMRGCMDMSKKVYKQTLGFTTMFRHQVPKEYQTPALSQAISTLEDSMKITWQMIDYEETRRRALAYRERFSETIMDYENQTLATQASTVEQTHASPSENGTDEASVQFHSTLKENETQDPAETPKPNVNSTVVTDAKPEPKAAPLPDFDNTLRNTTKEESKTESDNLTAASNVAKSLYDGDSTSTSNRDRESPTKELDFITAKSPLGAGGVFPGVSTASVEDTTSTSTQTLAIAETEPDAKASPEQQELATQPDSQEESPSPPDPPTGMTPVKDGRELAESSPEDKDDLQCEAFYIPAKRVQPEFVPPENVFPKAPTTQSNLPASHVIMDGITPAHDIFNTFIRNPKEESWQVGNYRSTLAHLLICCTKGWGGGNAPWYLNGISFQGGKYRLHGDAEFLRHNYINLRNSMRSWLPEDDAEQIDFIFPEAEDGDTEGGILSPIDPVNLEEKMGNTNAVSKVAQSTIETATVTVKLESPSDGEDNNNSSEKNAQQRSDNIEFRIGAVKSSTDSTEGKKRIIRKRPPRMQTELKSDLKH